MADQYVDAAGQERFEAAVALARRLYLECEARSVEDAAAAAVIQAFCLCVTDANDQMEHQLSPIHTALIAEVADRVMAEAEAPADPENAHESDAAGETFAGSFRSFGSAQTVAPSRR